MGFVGTGAFAGAEVAVVFAGDAWVEAPLPAAGPVAPVTGLAAGVGGGVGNDVSGVGTGGRGFERTPAIISVRPLSKPACRAL